MRATQVCGLLPPPPLSPLPSCAPTTAACTASARRSRLTLPSAPPSPLRGLGRRSPSCRWPRSSGSRAGSVSPRGWLCSAAPTAARLLASAPAWGVTEYTTRERWLRRWLRRHGAGGGDDGGGDGDEGVDDERLDTDADAGGSAAVSGAAVPTAARPRMPIPPCQSAAAATGPSSPRSRRRPASSQPTLARRSRRCRRRFPRPSRGSSS